MEETMFWMAAAGMAAVVVVALAASLRRPVAEPGAPGAEDVRVYRDQLAEIDRDLARATITAEEAQRLRTEVSRRLLEADRKQGSTPAARPRGARAGLVAAGVVLAAGLGALAVYDRIGAPGYPDLPLAERIAMVDAAMAGRPSQAEAVAAAPALPAPEADPAFLELMDKLRAAVAERPDDIRGLELLARNEAGLGNLAAAEEAQRRLIAAKGDAATAEDEAGLAEIMIRAAGGYISPQAEGVLVRALQRDPRNGTARYFSGLMFAQGGRFDRAFLLWRDLLAESPPEAPWVGPIRAQIEEVAFRAGVTYTLPDAPAALPGPDGAAVAAAAEMTEAERQQMVEGMVEQLAERLATEGGTAEEWGRLIRSLGMLGQVERATAIYREAQVRFEGRRTDLSFLRQLAVEAGVDTTGDTGTGSGGASGGGSAP